MLVYLFKMKTVSFGCYKHVFYNIHTKYTITAESNGGDGYQVFFFDENFCYQKGEKIHALTCLFDISIISLYAGLIKDIGVRLTYRYMSKCIGKATNDLSIKLLNELC